MPRPVIVDAVRTPIGRFGGSLLEFSATELVVHLLQALLERNHVPPEEIDAVILGQVIQAGSGPNVARQAAVRAGLPVGICGWTVNMTCASGLKAIDLARQDILCGAGSLYLAGGTESMSRAPFLLPDLRWGHKLGSLTVLDTLADEALRCPLTGLGMGLTAEEIATRTGITRQEMDAWAARSQERALSALRSGRFADEIVPVPRRNAPDFAQDEHPRETSPEALAQLKPAFQPDGCVTAGNASGINDGAAALLIAEETCARQHGWKPRATLLGAAEAGVEPEVMGLGPVGAVRKLSGQLGISLDDFDLVELNEAFAVQTLAVIRELGLDEERVNVNGGGIALGHPVGATGARLVTSLLYEMEKRNCRLGLATLCVGGGMGMAMAIEREG